jgi:hypothetical protein
MSAPRFDPFPGCRDQLIAQVEELEVQANELRTVITGAGSSAQWHREQLGRKFDGATKLKNILSETCRRVADNPTLFNLSADELAARQRFLAQIETRLRSVEVIIAQPVADARPPAEDSPRRVATDANQYAIDRELGHRQELIRGNEEIIGEIAVMTAGVRATAAQIGGEIEGSNVRLAPVGKKMDSTHGGLDKLVFNVREFAGRRSTWLWIGCVVLTIIVIVLLVWVILGK